VVTKIKPPTVQQLVDVIHEYNVARGHELQTTKGSVPQNYKNPLMDNLYDAANASARTLALLQVTEISIAPRNQ